MKMKKVDRHTRAGKRGIIIECPKCSHRTVVYHLSWIAKICTNCKENIAKYSFIEPRLTDEEDREVRRIKNEDDFIREICFNEYRDLWEAKEHELYWEKFTEKYAELKAYMKKKKAS